MVLGVSDDDKRPVLRGRSDRARFRREPGNWAGIAQGFADRGATVVITGRVAETIEQTARELRQPGGCVRAKVCDVADAKAIHRLVDEVIDEFGRIDTLVNCAGVNKRMKVEDYNEATTTSSPTSTSRARSSCRMAVGGT